MNTYLQRLVGQERLSRQDACDLLTGIVGGACNDIETGAMLAAMQLRGVTVDELLGFRDGLLATGVHADLSDYAPLDIVGTGGDGKNTFNISTCACFVVAAAGQPVAKHGNYAATSSSGASDVLEQHGVRFTADPDRLRRSLDGCGIAYLHAPLFALGMKAVAPVRKALGIRTVFNLLGPLVNPALPRYQLLGVARLGQLRLYDGALRRLGTGYGLVNSADGYDEVSLTGRFKLLTRDSEVLLEPADLGFEPVAPQCLSGGTSRAEARAVFDAVLDGSAPRPQRDVVAANAGLALSLTRPNLSLADCIATAREALESGAALRTFRRFVELNT